MPIIKLVNDILATEMAFNRYDAVGLFKNGVLIDIIGTINGGTANFAADETIRRKATVLLQQLLSIIQANGILTLQIRVTI